MLRFLSRVPIALWYRFAQLASHPDREVRVKGGGRMTESPLAALYCLDPNCKYCNELRQFNAQLRKRATTAVPHAQGEGNGPSVDLEIETLRPPNGR